MIKDINLPDEVDKIELIKPIESIYPSSLGHQHMVFCIAILKQKAHHTFVLTMTFFIIKIPLLVLG